VTQKEKDELINCALIANLELSVAIQSSMDIYIKILRYEEIMHEFTNNIIKMTEKKPQLQLWPKS
jgi:hypothetical protein